MERIAPLAKILAEANGIDWEKLSGTGDGGMIVEQDILNYLSRVMSGEEDPPDTPVDAPPPDWTGEDIPGGGMFDASMLKGAGVDEDIASFVTQARPPAAAPAEPVASAPLNEPEPSLPEPSTPSAPSVSSAPSVPSIPATPTVRLEDEEFELDDEVTPATPAAATPEPVAPAVAAPAAGLGSLLSRLYHKDTPAESAPVAPAVTPSAPTEIHTEAPRIHADVPPVEAPAHIPAVEAPRIEVQAMEAPVMDAPAAQPSVIEVPTISVAPAVAAPEPVVPQPVTQVPAHEAERAVPAPTHDTVPAPVVATPGPAHQPQGDAVWFGTYLRRQVNVDAATSLAAQLGEALDREVTLAQLVARAAQRHAGSAGLGHVALHDHGRNEAVALRDVAFRDFHSHLTDTFEGTPDLLIVDAGHFGLDDLHYPHTSTLSVGRAANGHATLSFNGNVDTQKAAQLLGMIADTLEKPIVLVL